MVTCSAEEQKGEGEGIQDEDATAGEVDEQLEVVVVEGTDLTLFTLEEGGRGGPGGLHTGDWIMSN